MINLLEVLVSFVLLSLVMLGANASHLFSERMAKTSFYLATATQQLINLDDYLQAVHGVDSINYVSQWKTQLSQLLPQGWGELHGIYPDYRIAVYWGGETPASCKLKKTGIRGCLSIQDQV